GVEWQDRPQAVERPSLVFVYRQVAARAVQIQRDDAEIAGRRALHVVPSSFLHGKFSRFPSRHTLRAARGIEPVEYPSTELPRIKIAMGIAVVHLSYVRSCPAHLVCRCWQGEKASRE